MEKTIRAYMSKLSIIHALAALGLFAIWGYIDTNNGYILLGVAMSFSGAVCGSLIRITNAVRENKASS